jgi:transposase InsO family protein
MCDVLCVSRSGYYAWRDRPASAHDQADAKLLVEIKAAHEAGRGYYGSPRVHRALRNNGTRVSRKRVTRLMKDEGIAGKRRRKFCKTTDSKHPSPIAPNVLNREFVVELPNTAWVTDVTYVLTLQGWLYLAAILDLWSAGRPACTTTASSPWTHWSVPKRPGAHALGCCITPTEAASTPVATTAEHCLTAT